MMTQILGFGIDNFNFLSNIETEFYEYLSFITERAVVPGANIFGATTRLLHFAVITDNALKLHCIES